ncbi:MAG: Rrf2 family transcriptional regulator [Alphaproteobacteria bacterium]|nr:Rrf2 family transcriptional regulator [Alphaproteobacteria bacterium]MBU0795471.1 Rrf2 family transcriptional regulator [Alphaproteobacteria bacterium]MBU0875343.1 Rrf2 family transcriptional regulator [Alphaproteobacteria bacterium]MBU1771273.1 Rrf2 family transcriptional regulator [Alphaproteobacteria bacterium]
MRLSSLADYAVLMMRTAATHCGGARANAASLAVEAGIPVPTGQKLASLLGRAGLIKATRGSGGGIKLARPAAAITLADIIEAVDGPIALTGCLEPHGADCCALAQPCEIRPHWIGVNALVRDALAHVTLAHLIASPETLPVAAFAAPGLTGPASATAMESVQ